MLLVKLDNALQHFDVTKVKKAEAPESKPENKPAESTRPR
jgi:hypothetical protein